MKLTLIYLVFLALAKFSTSHLTILSPKTLKDSLTKVNKGNPGEIKSEVAKFGQIPFGKTINGHAHLENTDSLEANDWCDPSKFVYIQSNTVGDPEEIFPPIVIASASGCSFSQKARTVQQAKGGALIIISSGNHFEDENNLDDYTDKGINIPTIIITQDSGALIFDSLRNNTNERIVFSLSFKDSDITDKVYMELYFRSDQVKALHFFNEFAEYFEKLGSKLVFVPYYKYTECLFCPSSNTLDDTPEDTCFFDGKFCGSFNANLEIENSRLVLLENLRQKCIFEKYPTEKYWTYMSKFSDICSDLYLPTFNKKCSKEVMKIAKISNSQVEECMTENLAPMADDKKNYLKDDYAKYESESIHRFPQIVINKKMYKGNWLAQSIFKNICDNYLSNDDVCKPPKKVDVIDLTESENEISAGTIILILLVIVFTMVIITYCYRRIVNKTIDETIENRIFNQTKDSVGNYSNMDRSDILK
eukprot:CAMPEP_0170517792 /NCGR_PEP_ID=MMETSP0209-20121228/3657_1 /TAXON_ID=665100 ORGANISM="Litonotus pictus, Strain P1" /NCGR_SAMPLE_ID=MMETSP0209 /ASSEMBLY_ACC=CAM_ASM_000301 /LENGTH=475 /DNA_ID=CAMNT_0010803133 /DNA_START=1 /DNA_END=1428 /DNA_ORIENTATION=+